MPKFRETAPKRTYTGPELNPYRKYKKILQKDFNGKCGYTNCKDQWFGGSTKMDIEHFKPKSKFPELKNNYANLAYCCSFVNRAKSDDFDEKMYLDPCDVDYNKHFSRDEQGNIIPAKDSPPAQYMHKKLKLYLARYGIIWMLTTIQTKIRVLAQRIEKMKDSPKKQKLLTLHYALSQSFQQYLDYLDLA